MDIGRESSEVWSRKCELEVDDELKEDEVSAGHNSRNYYKPHPFRPGQTSYREYQAEMTLCTRNGEVCHD